MLPADYPFANSDWNRSFTQPGWSGGLVWKIGRKHTLREVASRAVDLPSLMASGAFLIDTPATKMSGSPFLHPTVVSNFEIGWDRSITRQVLLRMNVLHMHSSDVQSILGGVMPIPGGRYLLPESVGKSDANVMEVGVTGIDSVAPSLERLLPTEPDRRPVRPLCGRWNRLCRQSDGDADV